MHLKGEFKQQIRRKPNKYDKKAKKIIRLSKMKTKYEKIDKKNENWKHNPSHGITSSPTLIPSRNLASTLRQPCAPVESSESSTGTSSCSDTFQVRSKRFTKTFPTRSPAVTVLTWNHRSHLHGWESFTKSTASSLELCILQTRWTLAQRVRCEKIAVVKAL